MASGLTGKWMLVMSKCERRVFWVAICCLALIVALWVCGHLAWGTEAMPPVQHTYPNTPVVEVHNPTRWAPWIAAGGTAIGGGATAIGVIIRHRRRRRWTSEDRPM